MVKTQLQAQSQGKFAVGFQHNHSGMIDALSSTYKQHGFRGLYRGFQGALDNYILMLKLIITHFSNFFF